MLDNSKVTLFFTLPGIILSIAYLVYAQTLFAVGILTAFAVIRVVELLVEGLSNKAMSKKIDDANLLLKDVERTVNTIDKDVEDRLRRFDAQLDERIDIFVRGANSLLSNMNAVTMGMGYGEQFKKLSKEHMTRKGNDGN